MTYFEEHKLAVDKLYNSLSPYFEKDEYYDKIKKIMDRYSDNNTESWRNSNVRRIFQVHERFLLVRHLRVEKNRIRMPENKLYDSVEKHFVAYMYPSLCTYLLLTCFDQLGQPDDGFVSFSSWLEGDKKKNERDEIIKELGDLSNISFTKELFSKYNKIYSVRTSFSKFIKSGLTIEQRSKLLTQILIEKYDRNGNLISKGNENDKKEWLYAIRNDYTHSSYSTETNFSNLDSDNWDLRSINYEKGKREEVKVSLKFNLELENSILVGIAEKIRKNSENTEGEKLVAV